MKIQVAQNAGFCFGVRRAIDMALKSAKCEPCVYMLGDIVHNENVISLIERSGIKRIKRLSRPQKDALLIRAHGSAKAVIKRAQKLGYKIIDATCPTVKEIHRIVTDMERRGYKIIIIGDHKHAEVKGIIGQIKHRAICLEAITDIDKKLTQKLAKAAVVVQSTQNLDKALRMHEILKCHIKDLKFYNTICAPTRAKQKEIKILPRQNDCVIIIGSKTSANTKRLYEISKSININSYWINSIREIRKGWFKGIKSVGITAGASTPDETINAIKNHLKKITS